MANVIGTEDQGGGVPVPASAIAIAIDHWLWLMLTKNTKSLRPKYKMKIQKEY